MTNSWSKPVFAIDTFKLPGALARLRLDVINTTMTVRIRLRLNESVCTTKTGRRNAGSKPVASGSWAHYISTRVTTDY